MNKDRRRLLIGAAYLGGSVTLGGILPATCSKHPTNQRSVMRNGEEPRRPLGAPKPLLEEDVSPVLARFEAWCDSHLPREYAFNPPATDLELDELQREVGLTLPKSYRQLYRWHNGDKDWICGHIYGLPILPLHDVVDQWRAWVQVLEDPFKGNRYEVPGAGWPVGAVDPAYINPRWLPLTHDAGGNHIGLDFDPWPNGRVGQVILFGRDEDVKVVVAESLGKFLDWITGLLEQGNFRVGPVPDENGRRQFRLRHPSVDHFEEGARTLLGAPGPFLG